MSRSRSAPLPTPVPLLPMDNLQPTFSEFRRLARQGNVVPVFKAVVADTLTPVSAYLRLAEGRPYSFMLESVEGGETLGRYTFLGVDPFMIVRCRGNRITIERGRGKSKRQGISSRYSETSPGPTGRYPFPVSHPLRQGLSDISPTKRFVNWKSCPRTHGKT